MGKAILTLSVAAISLMIIGTSPQAAVIKYKCCCSDGESAEIHVDTNARTVDVDGDPQGNVQIDNAYIYYGSAEIAMRINRKSGAHETRTGGEPWGHRTSCSVIR